MFQQSNLTFPALWRSGQREKKDAERCASPKSFRGRLDIFDLSKSWMATKMVGGRRHGGYDRRFLDRAPRGIHGDQNP
jgi:hypothetical protein